MPYRFSRTTHGGKACIAGTKPDGSKVYFHTTKLSVAKHRGHLREWFKQTGGRRKSR